MSEVRKYTLDMNINTKIPEQEFHKLWFYQIRIKFQGLCVHPFNFKILGLSAIFSAIIQSAVCQDFCCFCCWPTPEKIVEKKTTVETSLIWVNFCWFLFSFMIVRVTILKHANITEIFQKMPKFCSAPDKATRSKAKI